MTNPIAFSTQDIDQKRLFSPISSPNSSLVALYDHLPAQILSERDAERNGSFPVSFPRLYPLVNLKNAGKDYDSLQPHKHCVDTSLNSFLLFNPELF